MSLAIQQGHKEVVAALLQHKKINVNARIKDTGYTPIYLAVVNGDHYSVSLLIEKTTKLEQETCMGGITSLHNACFKGDADMVSILLYAKLNPNERLTANQITPLFLAASLGYPGIF